MDDPFTNLHTLFQTVSKQQVDKLLNLRTIIIHFS